MNKVCLGCGKHKPMAEYHNQAHGTDGKHPRCKLCVNTWQRRWQNNNREKTRAYVKKWADAHREYCAIRDKIYREENAVILKEKRFERLYGNPERYAAFMTKKRELRRSRCI